jgi:hypothetical protein
MHVEQTASARAGTRGVNVGRAGRCREYERAPRGVCPEHSTWPESDSGQRGRPVTAASLPAHWPDFEERTGAPDWLAQSCSTAFQGSSRARVSPQGSTWNARPAAAPPPRTAPMGIVGSCPAPARSAQDPPRGTGPMHPLSQGRFNLGCGGGDTRQIGQGKIDIAHLLPPSQLGHLCGLPLDHPNGRHAPVAGEGAWFGNRVRTSVLGLSGPAAPRQAHAGNRSGPQLRATRSAVSVETVAPTEVSPSSHQTIPQTDCFTAGIHVEQPCGPANPGERQNSGRFAGIPGRRG